MAAPVTGTQPSTWFIHESSHTPQELKTYVEGLIYGGTELKMISLNFGTFKRVCVNGITMEYIESGNESAFDDFASPYEINSDGNRPLYAHYYSDRNEIEFEYDHHPFDPKPLNTRHAVTGSYLTFLQAAFASWKALKIADYEARIADNAAPTF